MNDLFATDLAGALATWVAALVTVGAWSYLAGARRLFHLLQLLFAGLASGYLAVLAVQEVLLPRLVAPLFADLPGHALLLPAALGVVVLAAAHWLPRRAVAVPVGALVGGTAAFALGGAVIGTLVPQMVAALPVAGSSGTALVNAALGLVITAAVALGFVHGLPADRRLARAAAAGRWLLLVGIGGWLGFLVVSRLTLLVDRIDFLLWGWLGVGR